MSTTHEPIPFDPAAETASSLEDTARRNCGMPGPDDGCAALASWLAFEQGALSEAPMALAAWLDHRRFTDAR